MSEQQNSEQQKSEYKTLTPKEQQVILNKGTEPPFVGEYTDHFEAGGHYISFIRTAVGQLLMMRSKALSDMRRTQMVSAQKFFALIAMAISGTCLTAKDLLQRTPGTA